MPLLVGVFRAFCPLCQYQGNITSRFLRPFKIITLFVTPALVFETLDARFHPAPSSLFLITLTLADGERKALFLIDYPGSVGHHSLNAGITITNTGEEQNRSATRVPALLNHDRRWT